MRNDAVSYLAYIRSSRPTGKALARALGVSSFGIRNPEIPLDVLIRWGSRKVMPHAGIIINTPEAVKRASNKLICFDVLNERAIPTIPAYKTWDSVCNTRGIVLGRSATGFGGKDIIAYDPSGYAFEPFLLKEPVKEHDWYSVYKEPTLEVRIHVVGGKIARIQGKYCDFPTAASINPYIRNYEHGYRFRTPRQEIHRRRKHDAILAVEALGLDFGAVDMLMFGGDRGHCILEVNSAPACSPLTARCYAGEIALLVEQRSGGSIRLAPSLMMGEVDEMPEDGETDERYIA